MGLQDLHLRQVHVVPSGAVDDFSGLDLVNDRVEGLRVRDIHVVAVHLDHVASACGPFQSELSSEFALCAEDERGSGRRH